MPSILDEATNAAKVLVVGKTGAGKTGCLASLVAAGYRLRIVDTDKGVKLLRSLLTDPRYPYAKLIRAQEIDLTTAVRFVPIDIKMSLKTITRRMPGKDSTRTTSETLLAPTEAGGWAKVLTLLDHWKDGEVDLGAVQNWGPMDVLVIDSLSTLARVVYYFSQALNGRLGSRDSGYDYQRDVHEAQGQLTRFLELLSSSVISCNVVVITHITWVDESQGVASRPQTTNADGETTISQADGYPSAIGRALSPHIGKYFNDSYIVRATGTGSAVRQTLSTVPQEGVSAKSSVFLDREYPISFGLATIFSALRGIPLPQGFAEAFASAPVQRTALPAATTPGVNVRPPPQPRQPTATVTAQPPSAQPPT